MSKPEPPNPYEYLRLTDVLIPADNLQPVEHRISITENNAETAVIITVSVGQYWCGGIQFYWHHGGVSYKKPDPANGVFRTEREARLYYIGYLSLFFDYYIDDTKDAIRAAIHEYSQQTLF